MKRPDRAARTGEQGNILLMIFLCIALLGLLTAALTQHSTEQSGVLSQQTQDDQINRMITYASTLGAALQQMVVNGEDPNALYSNLILDKPGDLNFESGTNGRHRLQIYHPLGGGVAYQSASAAANAVATNYNINAGAIITGVGATDATVGDIVFTANISSAAYCGRINQILTNSSTVPVMDSTTFTNLFGGATVTITAGNCASCVNTARLCVSNGSNAWGFYAALLPG